MVPEKYLHHLAVYGSTVDNCVFFKRNSNAQCLCFPLSPQSNINMHYRNWMSSLFKLLWYSVTMWHPLGGGQPGSPSSLLLSAVSQTSLSLKGLGLKSPHPLHTLTVVAFFLSTTLYSVNASLLVAGCPDSLVNWASCPWAVPSHTGWHCLSGQENALGMTQGNFLDVACTSNPTHRFLVKLEV